MKRLIASCILLMAVCTLLMAVPARRGVRLVTQPNGDTLRVELIGDEAWHAYYTEDGYLLRQGEDGWWYYAKPGKETYRDMRGMERQTIVATRRKAQNEEQRCRCRKNWLKRNIPNRKANIL